MLEELFITLLGISVATSAVILFLKLLAGFFNKTYAAKWKYWIWLVLALRLIIPFNPTLPTTPVTVNIPNTQINTIVNTAPTQQNINMLPAQTDQRIESITTPSTQTNPLTLINVLILIWIIGGILFLTYQFIGYFVFRKKALRWSKEPTDARIINMLNHIMVDIGLKKEITVLISRSISSPLMTGFVKPLLILPNEDYSDTDLNFILRHELTHYKRHDLWYKLFLIFVNAVHWFNPFAYLMFHEASADLELSCDDKVINGLSNDERRTYSETILASITAQKSLKTALSTYFYGGRKTMKSRFANIFNTKKKRSGAVVLLVVMLIVSVSGGLVACSYNAQQVGVDKTAIIIKETALYEDASLKIKYIDVHKNDLVYVISKDVKGYYIQMPLQQIPPTEGYIPLNAISFDESLFSSANYGIIDNAMLYNTPNTNDEYGVSRVATIEIKERRDDGWVLCELPAGEGAKWVQADKIIYRVERAKYEMGEETQFGLGFSMAFPSSWRHKEYGVGYVTKDDALGVHDNTMEVYHIRVRDKYGEGAGRFFWISRYGENTTSSWAFPTFELGSYDGYTYYFHLPSDVQYPIWDSDDNELAAEYESMAKDIPAIRESIKLGMFATTQAAVAISSLVDDLYQYKNTNVGDNSKVVAIVDLLPIRELLTRDKVDLQTHNTPSGVGVYYKTDDRAAVREHMGQYEVDFKRNAAIMFALITNMDSFMIDIRDQYNRSDQYEDQFTGFYIIFENLNDYFGTDYFTKENLETAVSTKENFREFIIKVMLMDTQYNWETSHALNVINNIIGKGWEVIVNSGMGASFVLEENIVAGGFDLAEAARVNNIDIREYYGKKIDVQTDRVTNYAGQEPDTSYAFVFCEGMLIAYKNIGTDENARVLAMRCYEIEQSQQ